jgi:ppGpp synthetase/RelA/SpoT-type nucleotidyltranferase
MMTVSEPTIVAAVARYQREYDRYLKLCARVADICRYDIVERNAIRAHVTFRAKGTKSLENKLRKFALTGKKSMPDVDAVFAQVRDLAAVRVATYVQTDESKVTDAICRYFVGSAGGPVEVDLKDKHSSSNPENFYRAAHCEVFLPSKDIVGTYANVDGVPCEIQVCSMMAHVWNEIEHDIGYKPTGELSPPERSTLLTLGHLTRSGDGMITMLLAAMDARTAEQSDAFTDVYDFVGRARRWFPGVDFAKNAGPLFEELQVLRLNTLAAIAKQVGDVGTVAADSMTQLTELNQKLQSRGDVRYELDPSSADRLLVALLPKVAKHIVSNHPTGRGVGGPTRISWLAGTYVEIAAASKEEAAP